MFKLKMESYIFPEYADCQKTFVGASIARPCPFACEKTYPEKALLRQVGGRPMVAPTYSIGHECDFLTRRIISSRRAACYGGSIKSNAAKPGGGGLLSPTACERCSLRYRTPGKRAHLAPCERAWGGDSLRRYDILPHLERGGGGARGRGTAACGPREGGGVKRHGGYTVRSVGGGGGRPPPQ